MQGDQFRAKLNDACGAERDRISADEGRLRGEIGASTSFETWVGAGGLRGCGCGHDCSFSSFTRWGGNGEKREEVEERKREMWYLDFGEGYILRKGVFLVVYVYAFLGGGKMRGEGVCVGFWKEGREERMMMTVSAKKRVKKRCKGRKGKKGDLRRQVGDFGIWP